MHILSDREQDLSEWR